MHDIERWFFDGTVRSALSLFAAVLSVGAAVYTTAILKRVTRRNPYVRKKLRVEMEQWMSDVRPDYAKKHRIERPESTPNL